jgi:hypothetical protein
MEQGDTALPLIEAKSAVRPMGGVPPKRVSQSRSMVCACRVPDSSDHVASGGDDNRHQAAIQCKLMNALRNTL